MAKTGREGTVAAEGWPPEAQGNHRVHATTQNRVGPCWRAGHVCPHADMDRGNGARAPARRLWKRLNGESGKDQ